MRPRNLRHLERVRQPRAVVIAGRREEHLRLVLQPAERLAVDDAIAIALERRPDVDPPARAAGGPRLSALLAACGASVVALALLPAAPRNGHRHTSVPQEARAMRERRRRRRCRRASAPGRRTSRGCRGRHRRAPARRATRSGTYSREWSVLGVVGSLPWSAVTTSRSSGRSRGSSIGQARVEALEVRGVAGHVVAVPVQRVEVDEVGEDRARVGVSRITSSMRVHAVVVARGRQRAARCRVRRTGRRSCRSATTGIARRRQPIEQRLAGRRRARSRGGSPCA